ncbi:TnsD family Tn7-like transposition protein [Burkholderia ubonensis]|uniref:TnsD family Tn7-like transposition protein n=1 Tax=Burkholderia ubonensis TaxID=101571 RepID=UPI0009B3CC2B|nr:TnsD family Tn7-like transposition protein [Burkholderia ubonensis]
MIPLSFSPPWLPDELLYSWLARTLALNAMHYWPSIHAARLFSSSNVTPGIDLPTHLLNLVHNLGPNIPCRDVQSLLDRATIYPYYRPFIPPEREQKIRALMLSGNGGALKIGLGLVTAGFGALPPLRLCARCLAVDAHRYGSVYWHRVHQLPAVTCCPIHATHLVDHFARQASPSRLQFVLPPAFVQPATGPPPTPMVLCFARLSMALLSANLEAIDTETRTATYRAALAEAGFVKGRGMDYTALSSEMDLHYDGFEGFCHADKLRATAKNELRWLRALIERPQCFVHPIYHLLLIGYLFGDIDQFECSLRQAEQFKPTAPKPSFVSDWYRPRPIVTPEIEPHSTRHLHRPNRASQFSDRDSTSGQHGTFVARLAGVPVADSCFQLPHEAEDAVRAATHDGLVNMHRQIWSRTARETSGAGVVSVRASCPSTYRWLSKHDYLWLRHSCLELRIRHGPTSRVDWSQRDRELCSHLADLLPAVRATSATKRVTVARILRLLGQTAAIERYLERLPGFRARLEALRESPAAYQNRQIDACVRLLDARHAVISMWKIQRCTGIRRWCPQALAHAHDLCSENEFH